jgi:hypothetical protein
LEEKEVSRLTRVERSFWEEDEDEDEGLWERVKRRGWEGKDG